MHNSDSESSFPSQRSTVFIDGPAGRLECMCDVPETGSERPATLVMCHPHPQHGGSMHNKVVTMTERAVRELGLRTVRFNFRGVGASAGTYDEGRGETADLVAVANWVRRVRPKDQLWLGGFSFGAWISLRAAPDLHPAQLISIAPPVRYFSGEKFRHPRCPWLVIQGDADEIVNIDDVRQWLSDVDPRPGFIVLEHAGHFFHRRLIDLLEQIQQGVRPRLPDPAAGHD